VINGHCQWQQSECMDKGDGSRLGEGVEGMGKGEDEARVE
jgi:hypothetical protein